MINALSRDPEFTAEFLIRHRDKLIFGSDCGCTDGHGGGTGQANNPGASAHMSGLGDFFADVAARRLPASGVFYVRGGYGNILGLHPLDPNPNLATVFNGDDDHPGYSDSQLSESLLAREINAIAASPYWP